MRALLVIGLVLALGFGLGGVAPTAAASHACHVTDEGCLVGWISGENCMYDPLNPDRIVC